MNCNQLQDNYSDFFEGALSASERASFEQHLTACDGCREDYHVFAQVFKVLDSSAMEEVEVPNGFRAGVLARIAAEQARPVPGFFDWFRSNFLMPKGVMYGGAALLAASIVLVAVLVSSKPVQNPGKPVPGISPVVGADVFGVPQPASNVTGRMIVGVSDQTGAAGTTSKVFTLHVPQDVSTSAFVDADIVQDASALQEPDGTDGQGQSSAWDGTVDPDTSVQIPVSLTETMPAGKTLNMMLRWNDNVHPEQKELVFVPVAPSTTGLNSLQIPAGAKFYDAVQQIADAYQVTIYADPSALNALTMPRALGALTGSATDVKTALDAVVGFAGFITTQNADGSVTISHS